MSDGLLSGIASGVESFLKKAEPAKIPDSEDEEGEAPSKPAEPKISIFPKFKEELKREIKDELREELKKELKEELDEVRRILKARG
jgi:hypothetical protein